MTRATAYSLMKALSFVFAGWRRTMVLFMPFVCLAVPEPAAAAAEDRPSPIIATLVDKLTGESGHLFTTSGSAYILAGQGLQVNESGTNLLMNPGLESGVDAWAGTGSSLISPHQGVALTGSDSLRIAYAPTGSGAVTGLSTGGVSQADIIPGKSYTFSVHLKSGSGTVDEIMLMLSGDISEPSFSGPIQATTEWQRFSVTTSLGPDDSGLEASISSSGRGAAADIYIDAAQLEMKNRLTPYFDGDSTGARWEGMPARSRSLREGGNALLNTESGMDFNQPFWFAMETTLGFNRSDAIGSFPIGSKDFLNIGKPKGDGTGMLNNMGVVLDYYSVNKVLNFCKLGSRGTVSYTTPAFFTGDEMLVVGSYQPETGMDMWVRIGDNPVVHRFDHSAAGKLPTNMSPDFDLWISDSGAWDAYGDYHSNSLHRNFIVMQGYMSPDMGSDYLNDPEGFLQACNSRPLLSLTTSGARWESFADYQSRLLSVDYEISIGNTGMARNVSFVGSIDTGGVLLYSASPQQLTGLGTGGQDTAGAFRVKYQVPLDVTSFRSILFFSAEDSCGNTYDYPGPYPR